MRKSNATGFVILFIALFSAVATGAPSGRTEKIAVAPTNPAITGAIVEGVFWITDDGGATWRPIRRLRELQRGSDPADVIEESAEIAIETPALAPRTRTPETEQASDRRDRSESFPIEENTEASLSDRVDGEPAGKPVIAVGDRAEHALWFGGTIYIGNLLDHGTSIRWPEPPRAMLFDPDGMLWIAGASSIRVLRSTGQYLEWPLAKVHSIAVSADGGVLAASPSGLWHLNGTTTPTRSSLAVDSAEPLAISSFRDDTAVLIRGGVQLVSPHQEVIRIRTPGVHSRIRLGPDKLIFLADRDGRWFRLDGDILRPIDVADVAVDPAGNLWMARAAGPTKSIFFPGQRSKQERSFLKELRRAGPALLQEIGRLQCPPRYGTLLPGISIGAGIGRGETQLHRMNPPESARAVETIRYVAIGLTWTLRPGDALDCERQRQLRSAQLDQRLKRLRELILLRDRARDALTGCTDMRTCIGWQLEEEKQQALINSLTGR